MISTELYAILSTAHLKPSTLDNIASSGLIFDEGEARVRVRIPQSGDPQADIHLTADMKAAISAVQNHSPAAYGIMFDRDGDLLPDLPTYTWDNENEAEPPQHFSFSRWRHGGWYVDNVRYPNGACGCVSRNYEDGKWRIVCDPRPFNERPTFKTRDEAAAAEWLLAHAQHHNAPTGPRENQISTT